MKKNEFFLNKIGKDNSMISNVLNVDLEKKVMLIELFGVKEEENLIIYSPEKN